ncbi:MAG: DUF1501 domain-containing protein [Myxococcales bacterium]|nr:DUF1501 domain-containing protein [Myxococcales bacterium]
MARTPTRRDVLTALLGTGALSAFTGFNPILLPSARAQEVATDRYFLFCYFSGGWDLLMSLDPRDPSVFSPDLKKVTRIETGFEKLPADRRELVSTSVEAMKFGPYIGRLAQHADKLCVVRGLSMDTLTHEVGRRRFITGIPPAGLQAQGSSLMTVLASHLGANDPIPQLSVRVESYNDRFPSYASAIKVGTVDDLLRALRNAPDSLQIAEQQAIDEVLEAFRACPESQADAFLKVAHESRHAAADLVSLNLAGAFDFSSNTATAEAIRDRYGFAANELKSAGAQAAAAVTALTSGIARTASVMVAEDLDAHGPEWATAHGPRLEAGFDVVAAILEDLASREYGTSGDSWLDHTTVIGFSEFARTAMLNSSGGRDHHLVNAAFLAGAGIRGGTVLGASSDLGMAPVAVDLATGARDPGGTVVNPEHIFRALLQDVGIEEDVADYRKNPFTAVLS